jgi:hypothetical protein
MVGVGVEQPRQRVRVPQFVVAYLQHFKGVEASQQYGKSLNLVILNEADQIVFESHGNVLNCRVRLSLSLALNHE